MPAQPWPASLGTALTFGSARTRSRSSTPRIASTSENVCRDTSATHTETFRVQHQDGAWRWLATAWTNLLTDPHVQAIVWNARDVSEQKHAQDILVSQAHVDAAISELHRSLASATVSVQDLNDRTLRCARDVTGSDRGFLTYVDPQ